MFNDFFSVFTFAEKDIAVQFSDVDYSDVDDLSQGHSNDDRDNRNISSTDLYYVIGIVVVLILLVAVITCIVGKCGSCVKKKNF